MIFILFIASYSGIRGKSVNNLAGSQIKVYVKVKPFLLSKISAGVVSIEKVRAALS